MIAPRFVVVVRIASESAEDPVKVVCIFQFDMPLNRRNARGSSIVWKHSARHFPLPAYKDPTWYHSEEMTVHRDLSKGYGLQVRRY